MFKFINCILTLLFLTHLITDYQDVVPNRLRIYQRKNCSKIAITQFIKIEGNQAKGLNCLLNMEFI